MRSFDRAGARPAIRAAAAGAVLALALGGCVVYETAPGTYSVIPPAPPATSFDRSWAAAAGALADQGVQVTTEDRAAGILRGSRGSINVSANVRTQADGSVRVEFGTSGATAQDPTLIERISQSYERRMGR
jgi:hypothetical protein